MNSCFITRCRRRVRHLYPNQIISLYNALVIPKLLYGIEIINLTVTEKETLNRQARCSLKSLLGVSKHAKNLVNRLYNLENVSVLLDNRKIRLISELVRKEKTRSYVLHVMTLSGKGRSFSIVEDIRNACVSNNVDFGM